MLVLLAPPHMEYSLFSITNSNKSKIWFRNLQSHKKWKSDRSCYFICELQPTRLATTQNPDILTQIYPTCVNLTLALREKGKKETNQPLVLYQSTPGFLASMPLVISQHQVPFLAAQFQQSRPASVSATDTRTPGIIILLKPTCIILGTLLLAACAKRSSYFRDTSHTRYSSGNTLTKSFQHSPSQACAFPQTVHSTIKAFWLFQAGTCCDFVHQGHTYG